MRSWHTGNNLWNDHRREVTCGARHSVTNWNRPMSSQEWPPGKTEVLAWVSWVANPGELCWEVFPLGTTGYYRWVHGSEKVYSLRVILLFFSGQESWVLSAELGEKCEAIDKKLLYLEDQLHAAIHSHDEDLIHILFILQIKHLLGSFVKASLNKRLSVSMP